jgi:hypothetical protein
MELRERMVRTTAGQVTWASPELGKKCIECRHFDGACLKVKVVSGLKGKPYDGKKAIACSVFEGLDTQRPNL